MPNLSELRATLRELQFRVCMQRLEDQGVLTCPLEVETGVYTARLNYHGWAGVAHRAAEHLPGITLWTRNRKGFTWLCGTRVGGVVIASGKEFKDGTHTVTDQLSGLISARALVRRAGFTGELPWSYGGLSKRLLRYIVDEDDDAARLRIRSTRADPTADFIMAGIEFGYHKCVPGTYSDAALFDITSAYYQLLQRLTDDPKHSFKIVMTPKTVNFQPWDNPGQRVRALRVLELIGPHKAFRNALVGSMMGSGAKHPCYYYSRKEGKVVRGTMNPYHGPFRPCALLVVRSAYELTLAEGLTNACVYGNIDSLILTSGKPDYWNSQGIHYRSQDRGAAEVCCRGVYRVNRTQTDFYGWGDRTYLPYQPREQPAVQFHRQWL